MNHLEYISKKQDKTLKEWDKFMHRFPVADISDFEDATK